MFIDLIARGRHIRRLGFRFFGLFPTVAEDFCKIDCAEIRNITLCMLSRHDLRPSGAVWRNLYIQKKSGLKKVQTTNLPISRSVLEAEKEFESVGYERIVSQTHKFIQCGIDFWAKHSPMGSCCSSHLMGLECAMSS